MTKKNTQNFCNGLTPVIWRDVPSESKRIIFKTRCKQWSCEYCAKINYYQHWLRAVKGIKNHEDKGYKFDFVTLTSHERVVPTLSTYRVWQSAWTKLSTRYRRAYTETYGLPCAYFYVPELHKDGRLHIHGMFSGHIPAKWWKDNARECGLGYMAKSIKMDNRSKGTNYVLKYVTKSISEDIGIKRFRRINYSRNIPPLDKLQTDDNWNIAFSPDAVTTLIRSAWLLDLDTVLQGQEIKEIIDD